MADDSSHDHPDQDPRHSSPSKDDEQKLSSHDRRELERQKKEEERQKIEAAKDSARARKSMLNWSIALLVVAGLLYGGYYVWSTQEKPFTPGEVHWHTKLEMSICGQPKHLPRIPEGQGHLGGLVLHTHDDDTIHVEGMAVKKEDISVGRFFDELKVPFGQDRFFDKKAGDLCDGKPAKIKVWVNNQSSDQFRDIIAVDGQTVRIEFGAE